MALTRADGKSGNAQATVTLSYRQFATAFGGDWAARLRLVTLPECALTTPEVAACRVAKPVVFTNDSTHRTLTAKVSLPATGTGSATHAGAMAAHPSTTSAATLVLGATSDSTEGGGGGDFSATSLKPSGSWQAGGASDAFTWSYPLTASPVPGGLSPSLALSYNSQSLDGLTSNTNNQAGTSGDGWTLSDSYIERSYGSCHQNPAGSTQTWDECWSNNNQLTFSLNGHTSTLIKDDTSGAYHPTDDSNELVTYKTGAVNGAHGGEYWVVTTTDGTRYYFGLNQLPGYASGNATTNSVDTEPVYATASGQPCYNSTFSQSYCAQAYRWNLDYVVDTHGDAISYWYATDTNYYAQDLGSTAASTSAYTRDSYLQKIEYGQRSTSLYSATPAGEVLFTYNGRCNTSSTGCATSNLPGSTSTWPDVPYDLNCASGASCSSQSPSFWSELELTGVQTEALVGTTLDPADSWAFTYSFPPLGSGDTSTPSLWLSTIAHTGQDALGGGPAGTITPNSVTFSGTALANRVNLGNGYPWITRYRLTQIITETDEKISVNYSSPACGSSTPSSDVQNTTLCYPQYWYPTGHTDPIKEYFNKYIVQSVTQNDPTGAATANNVDAIETTYTPVGNPAWHYTSNPLTPATQDTWDQFRGYQGMIVSTGTAPDPITKTQYSYFQGMNGDYLSSSSTRSASVSDTRGDSWPDSTQLAGRTFETQVFNGTSLVTDTVSVPWSSSATATHAMPNSIPAQQSFMTGAAAAKVYTPLANGSTRQTETDYTHDAYGRVTKTNALGDVTDAAEHTCTTTSYADNTTARILNKPAEVQTVSVPCSTTPTLPANAVSDTLTFYDKSTTLGAAPSVGDATQTEQATSYTGSTPNYTVMSQATYDQYGRPTSATDANSHTTTTAYTPATGAEPTSIRVTDPMSLVTTTAYDAVREVPTQKTDPAGFITTQQYDELGRLTAVYKPGQAASTGAPNLKYTYTVSNSAPSVVDSYSLNDDGTYRVSETLYDALLRAREVQTQTVDGGRDITDTYYNTDGWQSEVTSPYYNASAVSTTYVQAQPGVIPEETGYTYDAAGRKSVAIDYAAGTQTWQTTYSYGGNFVTTVPPAGGTPQTTVTNGLGQQSALVQYHAGVPTDYVNDPTSDYSATTYTYTPAGKPATETDAAGNSWSWQYNLLGQQTQSVDPDTGTTTNTYNDGGEMLSATDARGKQTTYTYDKDDRKTGAYDTTSTQTLSTANQIAGWTFDTVKKGYPATTVSYSNGDTWTTSILTYNTLAKVQGQQVTLTGTDAALVPSGGWITSYGYTYAGNLSTIGEPAQDNLPSENLKYGYDEFGQPVSLASTGGTTWTYVSAVGYDEYGKPLRYTIPTAGGNIWIDQTYDAQTQALNQVKTTDSGSSAPIDQLSYTYGNAAGTVSKGSGLVTGIQDVQNAAGNTGTSTAVTDTQCFTYDYATRLQQAWTATDQCTATPSPGNSSTVGGPVTPYWQSWTYDAASSRLSEIDHDTAGNTANDTNVTYNYPSPGTAGATELSGTTATGPNAAAQTATYHYDLSGNQSSATGGPLGTQGYTWNDQGKLQTVTNGANTTNYAYDVDGNLLIARSTTSTVLYDGEAQLTNTGGTLTGVRFYTFGGITLAERTSSGVEDTLIRDRQGTDQLAVNTGTGQAVTRRQYAPFGAARGTVPAWIGTKGYVGGNQDASTGLENLGVRDYNPQTGRFLSADPVLEASDPTQIAGYDYAGNDPVTGSDPTGKMRMPDGGGGGTYDGTCQSDNSCGDDSSGDGGSSGGGGGSACNASIPGCPGSATQFAGGGSLLDARAGNNAAWSQFASEIVAEALSHDGDNGDSIPGDGCTNFVSDVLDAAGMQETRDFWTHTGLRDSKLTDVIGNGIINDDDINHWWRDSNSVTLDPWDREYSRSRTWTSAPMLYKYLVNNGAQLVSAGDATPGDIMFWQFAKTKEIHHTAVITSIRDGDFGYTQQNNDRHDDAFKAVENGFAQNVGPQTIYILRIPTPNPSWSFTNSEYGPSGGW
ncbi:hypothetical protein KGA66_27035 [Actinocrinis puniceicyclus]|uniref:RHS repeat-associated core domain-containing protein n=1 Tax=Actinocrinis puniceicyclus TaxID=977794 RepID=A0A8J7WQC6_9ACTN|nr:RHS repeat-associated core domain-containing protein [Actinocrinis puniceicyclus]MBS2966721.1 hypothetical protein [Actinocrinis puniceicyclus]